MKGMKGIKRYEKLVGKEDMDDVRRKAERISGRRVLAINSTLLGGGVAEILGSLVPLFNELGVRFDWRVLHGTPGFFGVTKKFHNALQGQKISLSEREKSIYCGTNRRFSGSTRIDHDLVIVHDVQPLPMIEYCDKERPWIFRCHVDLTNPNPAVWRYLRPFIRKYDRMVVSDNGYRRSDIGMRQSVIHPAIDPISPKNRPVSEETARRFLAKNGIDTDKPIISQVSRFDKWKDPLGVIKVFERVRSRKDCRLVLLGSFASDDPEGENLFGLVEKRAGRSRYAEDIKLLSMENGFLVNCLQRASSVVLQKSTREGFGLTVSEALYKGTPVVASGVGGIPLQVNDGVNGFLHDPGDTEGFAASVLKVMGDDALRRKLGENGKEHVEKKFLITRLASDWLDLLHLHLKRCHKRR